MTVFVLPIDEDPGALAVGEDGLPLPWCWQDEERTVLADSLTEIVGVILDGYEEAVAADDDAALLEARIAALAQLAGAVQAQLAAELADSSGGEGVPEEVLQVLLAPKDGRIVELDEWPLPVPLLVLSTQYAPYSPVPVPAGSMVLVLDPVSERGFLDALQTLGFGVLMEFEGA